MTYRKASEALFIKKLFSNFASGNAKNLKFCGPFKIFHIGFYYRYGSRLKLFANTAKQGRCRKMFYIQIKIRHEQGLR